MQYFPIFFLLISCFGYITFLSNREQIGFYKAPFIFCCFISLFIFFFALIDELLLGAQLVLITGALLLLLELYWFIADGRYQKKITFINFLVIFPYLIFYNSIPDNFNFLLWDEFSFWASSAKIIFETNSLFKENSPIFLKSYPPIQQLFQYYITKFTFWSEKNVLYAQTFWVLSSLLCVAGSFCKKPINVVLTFIISCSFLYFFNYSYSTIYSDPLLGVCFAACVALACDQRGKSDSVLIFFVAMAALVLIKEIAVFLALVCVSIFIVSYGLSHHNDAKTKINRIISTASIALIGLASTFGFLKAWALYVEKIHATRDIVIPNLIAFTDPVLNKRFLLTTDEFVNRLFKSNFMSVADRVSGYSPSVIFLFVCLLFFSVVIDFFSPRVERLKLSLIQLILFGGAFCYAGVLLFSYMVFFTEYEGIRLASFERYFSSYVLALIVLLFALFARVIESLAFRYLVSIQISFAVFVFCAVPPLFFKDIRLIQSDAEAYRMRQTTELLASKVKKYIKPDEKVYFVAQNSNGLERTMFYYAMLPFTSSMSWCWSFGKKYFDGDVWTCDTNLVGALDGYSYLAVYRGDDQLWQSAHGLFDKAQTENASLSLFVINRIDGKIDSIRRLE
jgi:hypothetical protein